MREISTWLLAMLLALAAACADQEPAVPEDTEEPEQAINENGAFSAELNGHLIHYELHGQGPHCMVLPVSWGLSHDGMRGMLKGLEEHLTMIYFDPRGMGRSGGIASDGDMSIAAVREDCRALLGHLGIERVILLGWSNSGMNAMVYAAEHPEQVERLILLHTLHYLPPEENAKMEVRFADDIQALGEMFRMEGSDEEKDAAWRTFFVERWVPLMIYDDEAHQAAIAEIFNKADLSFKHNYYQQTVDMVDFDGRDACARIAAPTLIIAGAGDIYTAEVSATLGEAIAGSTFVLLEQSGHFGPIEEPEKFMSAVLDFLEIR